MGAISSTVVAADGYTTAGDTGDNEGYNPKTNTWKSLASDPTPRHDGCYGVINGPMYIAGGGLAPIALNESYNLTSNGWNNSHWPPCGDYGTRFGYMEWSTVLLRGRRFYRTHERKFLQQRANLSAVASLRRVGEATGESLS